MKASQEKGVEWQASPSEIERLVSRKNAALIKPSSTPNAQKLRAGDPVFWPVAKLERHVIVNHAMRRFESCPASQD